MSALRPGGKMSALLGSSVEHSAAKISILMKLSDYLSPEEVARVEAKIAAVERLTSAEIKVVLTSSSWMGIGNKAARLFRRYGLDATAERNAVLLLIDVMNHELLVYGDQGINEKVEPQFWNAVRDSMVVELSRGQLAGALLTGIQRIGETLCMLFPALPDQTDEISNALLFER